MAWHKPKAAPPNQATIGWITANKHTIRTFVKGNKKHFYEKTVILMGMRAEDFPYFKDAGSRTVSGWVTFPTPDYNVCSKELFAGWEHSNLEGGVTRIDSIDLVQALALFFDIKPAYTIDEDEKNAATNGQIDFGD